MTPLGPELLEAAETEEQRQALQPQGTVHPCPWRGDLNQQSMSIVPLQPILCILCERCAFFVHYTFWQRVCDEWLLPQDDSKRIYGMFSYVFIFPQQCAGCCSSINTKNICSQNSQDKSAFSIPCEAALEQRNDMLRRASWRQRITVSYCSHCSNCSTSWILWPQISKYEAQTITSHWYLLHFAALKIERIEAAWDWPTPAAAPRTQAQAHTH